MRPELRTLKRTVSPALTCTCAGVKRMASVMSMSMLRVTRAASPGVPMGAEAAGMAWPACSPWAPAAKAVPVPSSAARAVIWVMRSKVPFMLFP